MIARRESPPLYRRRMAREYAFNLWLIENNVFGKIYSWTRLHSSMAGFEGFLPYYVYLIDLIDSLGNPIDMEEFRNKYGGDKAVFNNLKQIVKPRIAMMATDEFSRTEDGEPQIGDRVEFVFRRATVDHDDEAGLIKYLLKARRVID